MEGNLKMKTHGFEYFLNAVHYCMWLIDKWQGDCIGKFVNMILSPIPKIFFSKEHQRRCVERLAESQNDFNSFFYDKKNGYHIGWAHHWFGFFYSGYFGFLSFILLGIYFRFCGELNQIYFWLLIAVPIGLGYIPAYMAIYPNDKYLRYFKLFEKKDEHWHRKWKRITIVFCIGSVAAVLFGILAAWGILLLWR